MATRHKTTTRRGDAHEGEHETRATEVTQEEAGGSTLRRLGGFIKRRPVTALAVAAGVGALAGAEWAAGALLGGAAVALLATRSGADERRRLLERGRAFFARGRDRLSDLVRRGGEHEPRQPA